MWTLKVDLAEFRGVVQPVRPPWLRACCRRSYNEDNNSSKITPARKVVMASLYSPPVRDWYMSYHIVLLYLWLQL